MPRSIPCPKTTADIERLLGSGPNGIAIIWSGEARNETMYCATSVSPKLSWKDLPPLIKLGVHSIQHAKPDPNDKSGMPDIFDTRNITMELFTMDCDPTSSSFGTSSYAGRGVVLLRRGDSKSALTISKSIIEPLELFIEGRLAAIKAVLPNQEAASLEYAKLNAKTFKRYFKTYRAGKAKEYASNEWEKIACPVELEGPACEQCGCDEATVEGETASNLKKCGKCLGVQYCSRECQAEDWKAHKPFCKSAKK